MNLPAHRFLDEKSIQYEKLSFPEDSGKGAASVADALGYEPAIGLREGLARTVESLRSASVVAPPP